MYSRPLVPDDFEVPAGLETPEFRLRMLTVRDVDRDYEAVMASAGHLKGLMDPVDPWPEGLTREEDLIDLGWHQREFMMRHSFAYTVMTPDESLCLGCCYIYPADDPAFEAAGFYWAREDRLADGFEDRLGAAFRDWIARDWPFARVAWPGRGDPFPD